MGRQQSKLSLIQVSELTSILSMYPFVCIQKRQMPKHESTDITLEADIGNGVLNSIWSNLHLIYQCIVVRERLRNVASLVVSCCELGYVNTAWDPTCPTSVSAYLPYHIYVGGGVAKCWELLCEMKERKHSLILLSVGHRRGNGGINCAGNFTCCCCCVCCGCCVFFCPFSMFLPWDFCGCSWYWRVGTAPACTAFVVNMALLLHEHYSHSSTTYRSQAQAVADIWKRKAKILALMLPTADCCLTKYTTKRRYKRERTRLPKHIVRR